MRVGGGQRRVPAPSVAGAGGAVCALLWVLGGAFLRSGGPESVGVGSGLQDVAVEGEPVRDGGGQARVGERRSPLAERRVGGDRDAGAFVAFGEDLEQQLGAARVQVQIAELVEAADDRVLAKTIARYGRLDLICLDELGYLHLDPRGAELLFQVLTERDER